MKKNASIHFYFDWNVFKYISKPRNKNDESFSKLIYSIKDYIFIAYSPFHISGLLKNYDDSKYDYIVQDCKLISDITKNLCISKQGNQINLEYRDPLQMFKDHIETESLTENLLESDNIFKMMTLEQRKDFEQNFIKIKNDEELQTVDDPFYKAIIQSDIPEEALKKIIEMQYKFQNDPDTYNSVRSNLVNYKEKISELSDSEREKLNQELIKNGINKDLMSLYEKDFIEISNSRLNSIEDTEISNLYTFKDLFGITKPEKMTKKNSFKNIIDDSFHLDFAQYALYYISEDKANLEKAMMIKKEKDLQMDIYNIENALKEIRVSLYTKKNEI